MRNRRPVTYLFCEIDVEQVLMNISHIVAARGRDSESAEANPAAGR